MKYVVCSVSVAPVRAEHSDRSEMITQFIFGEKAEVIESYQKNWIKVKAGYDGYEGWCDPKQFIEVEEEVYHAISYKNFASDNFNLMIDGEEPQSIVLGTPLPDLKDGFFKIGEREYNYLGEFKATHQSKDELPSLAKLYLNTPYLWGGKSVFGIDCSGFTQQLYKMCGVKLPRDSSQQVELGEALSFVEEAEPGDLAFFDNSEGHIIHVGMILENHKIIHAHGKVRIDPLDTTGIFNTDSEVYSHRLRIIKRVF